jgi:hypothetical protein
MGYTQLNVSAYRCEMLYYAFLRLIRPELYARKRETALDPLETVSFSFFLLLLFEGKKVFGANFGLPTTTPAE